VPDRDLDTVLGWRGRTVVDRDGEKIGTLGELFLDRETDLPAWAGVRTGLFGTKQTFVPLARMEEDGDDLRVAYAKDVVVDAPRVDPEIALSEDEERSLFEHYGERWETPGDDGAPARSDAGPSAPGDAGRGAEVIRSEEEVGLGPVERRPVERVRLRRVTVTENVQRTVPVRREEVRLETDPPPEGRIESAEDVEPRG
jgi:hypothetical protein